MLHISISAEPLFHIGPLVVSNSLITTWLTMAVLLGLVLTGVKSLKLVPSSSGQSIWEMVIEFFDDLVGSMVHGNRKSQFFALVITLFLFILSMNWIGLMPGVGTVGLKETLPASNEAHGESEAKIIPFLRAGTADLNTTLALAIITMVAVQYFALKNIGLKAHLHKFFNFSGPMMFFVGILELVSEFAKVISFAFRLFGNVFAGEVLLAVMMFLVPILLPVPFLGMEIFVGLIQAFVFAMLALVFLTIATESSDH